MSTEQIHRKIEKVEQSIKKLQWIKENLENLYNEIIELSLLPYPLEIGTVTGSYIFFDYSIPRTDEDFERIFTETDFPLSVFSEWSMCGSIDISLPYDITLYITASCKLPEYMKNSLIVEGKIKTVIEEKRVVTC